MLSVDLISELESEQENTTRWIVSKAVLCNWLVMAAGVLLHSVVSVSCCLFACLWLGVET